MKKLLFAFVLIAVSVFTGIARQSDSYKNLAGTAEETGAMRLPSVDTLGVESRSAMLPIVFRNGRATFEIPVETMENLRLTLLAPNDSEWRITAKNGEFGEVDLRKNTEIVERRDGEVGLDGVSYPAEVFSFDYVRAGIWRVTITAPKAAANRGSQTSGFLVVTSESPYRIYSYVDTSETLTNRSIGIVTRVFDETSDQVSAVGSIEGTIYAANGAEQKLRFESGKGGQFRAAFTPTAAGEYRIQIKVEGSTADGENFIRTNEQIVQVLDENARFGKTAFTSLIDDTRLQVNLPVKNLRTGQKVVAYGEIWATDADGKSAPVAWLGGMSNVENDRLPITFDARWLAMSDAKINYELRNVRIQDPDYFVTLATADRIALTITSLPENALDYRGEISAEMRMGKKPERDINEAAGGKLMLVHGYCSGGNPFPTSQFSNNIVFSDPNKSRSHDQFANLIKNFGANYPSFGIVAHSQGGAASLHLYTYYWSGLDYASGNRLIQSVGTPYQGTALAGNLAALGSVFGAGCGTNYDLTYTGAAAWLSGIPTWARAKVHYSTTSFTDVWYRYDYCNAATDLFLSDPDDGVVEKAKGQLSGANNRGHKTGWCHTSGMRDPAQTSDSSRNADMNANAAR